MQKSGLILNVSVFVGFVFFFVICNSIFVFSFCSVDLDDLSYSSNQLVLEGNCVFENSTLFLYNNTNSITEIIIFGNFSFFNSTLKTSPFYKTKIIIKSGGFFNVSQSEIKSSALMITESEDIVIESELGSKLSIENSLLYHITIINIGGLFKIQSSFFDVAGLSSLNLSLNNASGTISNSNLGKLKYFNVIDSNFVLIYSNISNIELFNISNSFTNISYSKIPEFSGLKNISINFSNVSLRSLTYFNDYLIDGNSIVNFYDVNSSSSLLLNGTLFQFWTLNLNTYRQGFSTKLSLVDYAIYNSFNLTIPVFKGYTNYFGNAKFDLLSFKKNSSNGFGMSETYYSNYTLNLSKNLFINKSIVFNLTKPLNLNVDLRTQKGIIKDFRCEAYPIQDFCVDKNPKTSLSCLGMTKGDVCNVFFIINATDNLGGNSNSLLLRNFSFYLIAESNNPNVLSKESTKSLFKFVSSFE